MPIQDLHVTNIGPFDDMTFEFDEHINVFVGPNSSGKSTTLMTLANIATYPFTLPGRLCKTAPAAFTVHIVERDGQPQELTGVLPLDQEALAYPSLGHHPDHARLQRLRARVAAEHRLSQRGSSPVKWRKSTTPEELVAASRYYPRMPH
jgi:predicted ATPase